jgi:hypothetical protein
VKKALSKRTGDSHKHIDIIWNMVQATVRLLLATQSFFNSLQSMVYQYVRDEKQPLATFNQL